MSTLAFLTVKKEGNRKGDKRMKRRPLTTNQVNNFYRQPSVSIAIFLRSFGHQGALYYVFLASDPLKTSREYAVFTLRTRGPKVCTRETSRQTQRVTAFFVLIAPNDRITSYIAGHWRPGQNFMMFQGMRNETWFSKNGNIKNLVQKDKNGAVIGLYVYIFLFC